MFNKYYQDELTYLRELGRDFAREYPALAPVLGQVGADPDVERLLEGVAFLTGRVRQKLDDELPELIHGVTSLLFPHLLRPLPAATILEFEPNPQAVRDRRVVPKGTEFDSVPVDGTACRFSSSADCAILPWSLEQTRLEPGTTGRSRLTFTIKLASGLTLEQLPADSITIHIAEETRLALLLLLWILEHVERVSYVAHEKGTAPRSLVLPRSSAIRPVGLGEDEALLPLTESVLPGFRLIEEYFVLPAKFAFFELLELERLRAQSPKASSFDVVLDFDGQIPLARALPADVLRLHCVPVVNVFRSTAEPIRVSPERGQYLVRPAGLRAERGSVYAILDVVGVDRATDRRIPILPFFDYTHAFDPDTPLCYATHLSPGVIGSEADLSISLASPGNQRSLDLDVLSLELYATNARLGSQVRAQEIRVPTPTSPPFARFRNLATATPYVPVPLENELGWRATAHVATGLRTLADLNVLRSALRVYNVQGLVDRQAGRAVELRIDAIHQVTVKPAERLHHGSLVRGIDVMIELDEGGFAGDGDLYLFGAVLDRLYASYVPINSFAATTIQGLTTRAKYAFAPRSGNLEIL